MERIAIWWGRRKCPSLISIIVGVFFASNVHALSEGKCWNQAARLGASKYLEEAERMFLNKVSSADADEIEQDIIHLGELYNTESEEWELRLSVGIFLISLQGIARLDQDNSGQNFLLQVMLARAADAVDLLQQGPSIELLRELRARLQSQGLVRTTEELASRELTDGVYYLGKLRAMVEKEIFERQIKSPSEDVKRYYLTIRDSAEERFSEIKAAIDSGNKYSAIELIQQFFVQYILAVFENEVFQLPMEGGDESLAVSTIETLEVMFEYFFERFESSYLANIRVHLWMIAYDRLAYYDDKLSPAAGDPEVDQLLQLIASVRNTLDRLVQP